jgi:hypothetical protein
MDLEFKNGMMGLHIKDSIVKVLSMEQANLIGQMEQCIKAVLKRI